MKVEDFTTITEELKKKDIPEPIKRAITAMLDKKAEKAVTLKLAGINDITDYMLICSGNSQRQNMAICHEIEKVLRDEFKLKAFSIEGQREGTWILMDYIHFIVHIFSPENREKYALEKLWMDAERTNYYVTDES